MFFFLDFLIQELHGLININNLLNSTKQFEEYKKKLFYWDLNTEFSSKYHNDEEYCNYINSIIENDNKQLSITLKQESITDVSKFSKCHKLFLESCTNILDVSSLANLHTIKIHKGGIYSTSTGKGTPYNGIEHLGNVHTLELQYNFLNDESIKHLGNVSVLDLYDNTKITDEGLKYLGNIHTLNLASPYGNHNITDNGLKYLGNIHTLNLSNCDKITDEGLKYLGNINTLNLSNCDNITGYGFKHLVNIHILNLGCDHYYKDYLTDNCIKYLGKIHTLNLNNCKKITDEGLKYLGNVHTLNLSYCDITDEGVKHLGNVNTLDLSYCSKITIEGVKHLGNVHTLILNTNNFNNNDYPIINQLGKNIILKFERNNKYNTNEITNEDLKYLGYCHTLKLVNCKKITNEGVKYLGNVHTLDLSYCEKVSDEGIKHLGKCYSINLVGCNDITDMGLIYLGNCHSLYVDCSFTKNITEDCIRNLGNVFINGVKYNTKYYNDRYKKKTTYHGRN